MAYTIKIVSPKEFQAIVNSNPRYAGAHDSVGFADPESNLAYVMNTGMPQLTNALMMHEFEHLLNPSNEVHMDEAGIHHKKFFKDTVRNVASVAAAPLTGGLSLGAMSDAGKQTVSKVVPKEFVDTLPIVSSVAGSIVGGPIGGALGGAFGRIGKETLENHDPNASLGSRILSNAPGDALAGYGIGSGIKMLGGSLGKFTATSGTGGMGQAAKTSSGFVSSPGGSPSQGNISQARKPITTGMNLGSLTNLNNFNLGGGDPGNLNIVNRGSGGGGGGGGGEGGGNGLSRFLESISGTTGLSKGDVTRLGLGAGALAIGGLKKSPRVPDLSELPSVQALRANVGKPNSALGGLAQTRLSEQLMTPIDEAAALPDAILNDMRRSFDRQRQAVRAQFKQFRPNADLASDPAFRQALSDIDREEAAALANAQLSRRNQVEQLRQQDISTALGIDTQTLQQLTALAQLDIDEIQMQLGIDAADAQNFKQQFGQLGAILAGGALQNAGMFGSSAQATSANQLLGGLKL